MIHYEKRAKIEDETILHHKHFFYLLLVSQQSVCSERTEKLMLYLMSFDDLCDILRQWNIITISAYKPRSLSAKFFTLRR